MHRILMEAQLGDNENVKLWCEIHSRARRTEAGDACPSPATTTRVGANPGPQGGPPAPRGAARRVGGRRLVLRPRGPTSTANPAPRGRSRPRGDLRGDCNSSNLQSENQNVNMLTFSARLSTLFLAYLPRNGIKGNIYMNFGKQIFRFWLFSC